MQPTRASNAANLPAPTPPKESLPAASSSLRTIALPDTAAGTGVCSTSYDLDTHAGKAGFFRSRQDAEGSAADMRQGIEVEHVTIHPVQLVSDQQGGEVVDAVRVVLISPDGMRYACVSKGVERSIHELVALYGLPPWSPPLRVKLIEVQTRMGRRMYQLDLA
jgi:hypothetical protein